MKIFIFLLILFNGKVFAGDDLKEARSIQNVSNCLKKPPAQIQDCIQLQVVATFSNKQLTQISKYLSKYTGVVAIRKCNDADNAVFPFAKQNDLMWCANLVSKDKNEKKSIWELTDEKGKFKILNFKTE